MLKSLRKNDRANASISGSSRVPSYLVNCANGVQSTFKLARVAGATVEQLVRQPAFDADMPERQHSCAQVPRCCRDPGRRACE
jgi:hypothetical protein